MESTFYVDIRHLDAFEYDIAKTLFLTYYKDRFSFSEKDIIYSQERFSDIIKTSLAFWAFDHDDNQYKAIFLFNKPRPNVLKNLQQEGMNSIVFHKNRGECKIIYNYKACAFINKNSWNRKINSILLV